MGSSPSQVGGSLRDALSRSSGGRGRDVGGSERMLSLCLGTLDVGTHPHLPTLLHFPPLFSPFLASFPPVGVGEGRDGAHGFGSFLTAYACLFTHLQWGSDWGSRTFRVCPGAGSCHLGCRTPGQVLSCGCSYPPIIPTLPGLFPEHQLQPLIGFSLELLCPPTPNLEVE